MNVGAVNFCGKYVIKGNASKVNQAEAMIKTEHKGDVEFLPIIQNNNKTLVVATENDALVLRKKKTEAGFVKKIDKIFSAKTKVLANLFEYIFANKADALIVQDENLDKFIRGDRAIIFSTGAFKYKHAIEEKYVDETIKKHTLNGRLSEVIYPDGKREEFDSDGTRKIIYSDGTEEVFYSAARHMPNPNIFQSMENIPPKNEQELAEIENLRQELVEFNKKIDQLIAERNADVVDKKGRISKRTLENGIVANYYYKFDNKEPLFVYYSDGTFESKDGMVDKNLETIAFYTQDGVSEVYNKFGIMVSLNFPDGTIKKFDESMNLTEKIYPDGMAELFDADGKLYCIVHPDGTKEYLKKPRTSVFIP